MKKKIFRGVIEIGIIVGIIIKLFFFDYIQISGDSMMSTFQNGDIVLINKMVDEYKRNDIVIAYYQYGIFRKKIIKRVIGLPNEKIQIKNGYVYINDELLSDDIDIYIEDGGIATTPIFLGEEEYFLLGDNRNNSNDSRSKDIGIIVKSHIVGLVTRTVFTKE